ncbi:hypothetical protein ACLRDC_05720 [Gluconacetobacter sacchari]|uniref:hypothetical protein n=1 Tax=Gluconacetobacter sacchari TaxID=92759 RepID=UPI0039B41F72
MTATIDYVQTHITETIGYPSLSTELNGCYESTNLSRPSCSILHGRDVNGQLCPVSRLHTNTGAFIEDGLDINTSYVHPIDYLNALSFGADIQDVMATYHESWYIVTAGVKNIGGRDPNFYANGDCNTAPGIHDYVGRSMFIKAQAHF